MSFINNSFNRTTAAALLAGAVLVPTAHAQQVPEFWNYLGAGGELQGVEALLGATNKQMSTEIANRPIPGGSAGLRQQVQVSMMGGVPPVAYQVSAGLELNQLAQSGRLVPITDVWGDVGGDALFPEGLRQVISYDNEKYAMPFAMSMLGNAWYNKQLFDELGITPPTTWEEWDAAAEKIENAGYIAMTSGGGSPAWTIYQFYGPLIDTAGEEGYWEFAEGKMSLTDPRFVAAVDLFEQHFVKYFDDEWSGGKWADGLDRMMNNEIAIYVMGDWASGYMRQRGWVPEENFSFFPSPGLGDYSIFQADVAVLLKGDKIELGKEFVKAVASPEAQQGFNAAKGSVAPNLEIDPGFYDVISRQEYDKLMEPGAKALPNLYVLMPSGFKEDLGNAFTRFGATRDRAAFDAELARLDDARKELFEEGQFGSY